MPTRRAFVVQVAALAGIVALPTKGFAMSAFKQPEEAQPHQATFMQWPVSRIVHPDKYFLADLQQSIADIANTISEFEPVIMLMDAQFEAAARTKLAKNIEIWQIPTDDLWARDSGPSFVQNPKGELAIRHFNFNGWGNKQVHENDGQVARRVAERLGLALLENGLVGEPGGVEFDGHSTLIAHESSWINPNRNSGDKEAVSNLLLEAYGAKKIIWAPGVAGADITDYHIDSLARFVGEGRVLIQLPDEVYPDDAWSKSAYETFDILSAATDANGKNFELVELAEALSPRVKSEDFVAAYANYYICNGAVICAQFGDVERDAMALATLQKLYPDREVITLNVDPVGEVGGGIHCATQQWPKV
ncbi:agmatine deiminase family protein [Maritalea sp.]|uniref:agmatine deiminase family protein n=1 Tax=Maritalea sp. TaxID=2003361 RepID=UPI003EF3D3AA